VSDAQQADAQSMGERLDAAVENVRSELNARIDTLQQTVEELSAKIDAAQGQTPPATPEATQSQSQ